MSTWRGVSSDHVKQRKLERRLDVMSRLFFSVQDGYEELGDSFGARALQDCTEADEGRLKGCLKDLKGCRHVYEHLAGL